MTPTKEQKALAAFNAWMANIQQTDVTQSPPHVFNLYLAADTIRALLSAPEQESVTEITVEEFERECSKYRTDCTVMADYLITVYPNGLRIIRAEQGEG